MAARFKFSGELSLQCVDLTTNCIFCCICLCISCFYICVHACQCSGEHNSTCCRIYQTTYQAFCTDTHASVLPRIHICAQPIGKHTLLRHTYNGQLSIIPIYNFKAGGHKSTQKNPEETQHTSQRATVHRSAFPPLARCSLQSF